MGGDPHAVAQSDAEFGSGHGDMDGIRNDVGQIVEFERTDRRDDRLGVRGRT